jgi:hypothetical protein
VTHVVMEASGACTEPVYYALAGQDFEEIAVPGAGEVAAADRRVFRTQYASLCSVDPP